MASLTVSNASISIPSQSIGRKENSNLQRDSISFGRRPVKQSKTALYLNRICGNLSFLPVPFVILRFLQFSVSDEDVDIIQLHTVAQHTADGFFEFCLLCWCRLFPVGGVSWVWVFWIVKKTLQSCQRWRIFSMKRLFFAFCLSLYQLPLGCCVETHTTALAAIPNQTRACTPPRRVLHDQGQSQGNTHR